MILSGFAETEVPYLDGEVVEEEVGRFEISMDDIVLSEVVEPLKDFLCVKEGTLKNLRASH